MCLRIINGDVTSSSPPAVVLVTRPWDALQFPSIRFGILKATLKRGGAAAQGRSYQLAAMEHFRPACAALPPVERVTVADYEGCGAVHRTRGRPSASRRFAGRPRPATDRTRTGSAGCARVDTASNSTSEIGSVVVNFVVMIVLHNCKKGLKSI